MTGIESHAHANGFDGAVVAVSYFVGGPRFVASASSNWRVGGLRHNADGTPRFDDGVGRERTEMNGCEFQGSAKSGNVARFEMYF